MFNFELFSFVYYIICIGISIQGLYKARQGGSNKKILTLQCLTLLGVSIIALGIYARFYIFDITGVSI